MRDNAYAALAALLAGLAFPIEVLPAALQGDRIVTYTAEVVTIRELGQQGLRIAFDRAVPGDQAFKAAFALGLTDEIPGLAKGRIQGNLIEVTKQSGDWPEIESAIINLAARMLFPAHKFKKAKSRVAAP